MRYKIFLVDESEKLLTFIHKAIPHSDYEFILIHKNDLLSSLYIHSPKAILINLENFSDTALEAIHGALAIEYVPTICIIHSELNAIKSNSLPDSIILHINELNSLDALIKQAIQFSKRYTKLTETYDTIDLMNEETYKTLKYFIQSTSKYENEIICQFIKKIYNDNFFLRNSPSNVWLISRGNTIHQATLLNCKNNDLINENTVSFSDTNIFNYKSFNETGFFRNIGKEELSDVDDVYSIFPPVLLNTKRPLKNLVCYGNANLLLVAFDYNNQVSQYDINILKALAIKIDLFKNIKFQMREVEDAFIYTMNALARAAEGKDDITGHHIKRVNKFSKLLARELNLGDEFIHNIQIAAQMHDVGKIYIDKSILCKPGKLTDEEFQEIQKHTIYGELIIGDSKHLEMASLIARYHHEKYDGSGYPDGLKGEAIPLPARIVCLADIYDALRSPRSYKSAFSHEQAYKIITEGDGRVMPTHFDPFVLDAFKRIHHEFKSTFCTLEDI